MQLVQGLWVAKSHRTWNQRQSSRRFGGEENPVEIARVTHNSSAGYSTYLSLVADDARARHGGDRMVERWQSVGFQSRGISASPRRDPNFLLPLGELVVFAMLSILIMSTLHYDGYTFGID